MTVQGHGWDDNVGAQLGRNTIINGAYSVDQRNAGAAQTITAGAALAYTADRWYAYCTGANVTGQRVSGTAPFLYNYRFTGAASNTGIGFGTRLEAVNTAYLAGTTATLSAYIASSSLTSVTWAAYYANTTDAFGTVASPTRTLIATGSFSVSSVLSRSSVQISIPSAATTGIEVLFTTGALTATNTLSFVGVQLEAGGVASPFEFRPFDDELRRCQRYYFKNGATVQYGAIAAGYAYTTSGASFVVKHPTTLRTPPAYSAVTQSNLAVGYNNTSTNVLSIAATYAGPDLTLVVVSTAAVLTVGGSVVLYVSTSSGGYIEMSAEL